jgi:hypothetical protein
MTKDSGLERERRDIADQERYINVYRYLLALTDLGMQSDSSENAPGSKVSAPNETSIAKQWATDRIFVRRMLRATLYNEFYKEAYEQKGESPPPVPGLTLARLVSILSALQTYRREQQALHSGDKAARIISRAEKLKALRLFFQLAPSEKDQLELPTQAQEAILYKILDRATDTSSELSADSITNFYQFFLRHSETDSSRKLIDVVDCGSLAAQQDFIRGIIARYTKQHFSGLTEAEKTEQDKKLLDKVKREIDRIEIQAGIEQANTFLKKEDSVFDNNRLLSYLKTDFVKRLVHSVIDNELITDEFPIHLKFFEIERVKPLPLYFKQSQETIGVLNPFFLDDEADADGVKGLERQFAYRVRVHFYIKLPDDYEPKFEDITVVNTISGQKRLEFSEEVVGIGSHISQITSVINRVLFWDIPVLRDYSPVIESIHSNDEVIGGRLNSPVWSHCVVRLHRTDDLNHAILEDKPCDEVANFIETASADFCGFDLLETAAKAALHSRLKLIKQTLANQPGASASKYIKELCFRVEELTALKRAKQYLSFYPFSLRAMEGYLESTIFNNNYRERTDDFCFIEHHPQQPWSVVAFDAQLSIAEANLKEGLFHIARKYLDAVKPYFEGDAKDIIGHLLSARYHICWFRYYYLSDLKDPLCSMPDRYMAVRKAEEELEKAEVQLKERLKKYEKLDELPQSNLHPHFFLLSRIYAHRAQLSIFFSNYTRKPEHWDALVESVKLLENSKIYAARDGDPALYAQWSAYQSWCYIMLAYLGPQKDLVSQEFSFDECLDWAKRLIEHASICYSATGQICYQEIKNAGGWKTDYGFPTKPTQSEKQSESFKYYQKYGKTLVQVTPFIREIRIDDPQDYDKDNHVVELDLSLLKIIGKDDNSSIYLFGMQSSILLFAQGIFELCKVYEKDQTLIAKIQTHALRMFAYCYAIASDGTSRREKEDWPNNAADCTLVLDRVFPTPPKQKDQGNSDPDNLDSDNLDPDDHHLYKDCLLQGLYPHRLTLFADLGKLFVIVCELILLLCQSPTAQASSSKVKISPEEKEITIAKVRQLVKGLVSNERFPFDSSQTCGQTRYNGHLSEHYVQFEKYVEQVIDLLKTDCPREVKATAIRNQIVTDTFRILRGEINIMPQGLR